ncbi:hypothetical protein PROFUN_07191 [Planoprotostelium fungivorum]|uniref:DNA damage-binding protein 1 n=1 Tax=Planoprotostelium fungivorum TaxID=1890364 RepID=A0A2P6NMD4_9EUKA|nr:hypothetical protein PROFUN_07191 [Planoprotostelium fungivorum]
MSYNYIVTAQKPTAVTHATVGNFTKSTEMNLIISKNSRIEIHLLTPDGLQPLLDIGIYGRISSLKLFRPAGEQQDLLLVSTERNVFSILSYDSNTGEIHTRARGDVSEAVGKPVDNPKVLIDPDCRSMAFFNRRSVLKIIPMEAGGQLREAFDLPGLELQVLDLVFLHNTTKPTFVTLYQDARENRGLLSYQINMKDKSMEPFSISMIDLSQSANLLVAVPKPIGGVLILSDDSISHTNGDAFKAIPSSYGPIRCYNQVDDHRFLLGHVSGQLTMLVLDKTNSGLNMHLEVNRSTNLHAQLLGDTTSPNNVSYLDNGVVFIGSTFGDSQLIKMSSDKNEEGSFITELMRFNNLGPISDFCVVDLERQGQGQVVTCSGAWKDGSLRVIRNGVGINEQATIELPGIKGLWSLKPSESEEFDKYIILSFVGETRVLSMTGEELEETEIEGFSAEEQTIYSGNAKGGKFLQITPTSVRLVDSNSLKLVTSWTPDNQKINVASCNNSQIVLGTGGGHVIYLQIQGDQLNEIGRAKLDAEISCINIKSTAGGDSSLCVVGLWDISVRLLILPSLTQVTKESLGGEILPRSVLLSTFEGIDYLFIALGDGHLFTLTLGLNGELSDRRKISLGTQPIVLSTFRTNGNVHVFAASDRPTVIYSSNKKLLFSNVNIKEVNNMSSFHSESFPESIALATDDSLSIGTIDDIQKLHIKTVPLNAMPSRIVHQKESGTLGVIVSDEDNTDSFRLIDDQTFEVLHSFSLHPDEKGLSVASVKFEKEGSDITYYAVGTAKVIPTEVSPKSGRILLFNAMDGKLKQTTEVSDTKGAVYAIRSFNGKLLAGNNSKLCLYDFEGGEDGGSLKMEASIQSGILVIDIATRGDFIIVGDLMKGLSLFLYKSVDGNSTLEEIATDNGHWLTSVQFLDEETYIMADDKYNLIVEKRNSAAATDEERMQLTNCGYFHTGEFLNAIRPGSLVMKAGENEGLNVPTMIWASVSGAVGVIASLTADQYNYFHRVQKQLAQTIKGVGGFEHRQWRSFYDDTKTSDAKNCIDGDLVESFLDLPSSKMQEVAKALETTVEDLSREIETLQRAIH